MREGTIFASKERMAVQARPRIFRKIHKCRFLLTLL